MTRTAYQNRNSTRTRRLSACYRHPSEPVTGICAACLRERLSGDTELSIIPTVLHSFEDPDADSGVGPEPGSDGRRSKAATSSFSPDLSRCRSVSTARCEGSSSWPEPRRRSCDDRSSHDTLENLFGVDDEVAGSNVESENLRLTNLSDNVCQSNVVHKDGEEVRVRADALVRIEDIEDGELKTMKEFIDLEFHTKNHKSRDFRDIAVNFREAASVFSKKLQKWRQKQRENKPNSRTAEGNDRFSAGNSKLIGYKSKDSRSIGECAIGRRSCDTEPRFSVDAARLSLDGPRISIDEPRASWDGYMIARTIPRLTPMLSVVDNVLLGTGNGFDKHRASIDGQMQAIVEDESSSGGSGHSNSDSSSSQRFSSFDRSSSVQSFGKRTLDLEVKEGKYMSNSSPAHVNLVITERELKDWHLNSIKDERLNKYESISKNGNIAESCGTKKGSKKKPTRWQEVLNLFGNKQKLNNHKGETLNGEGKTLSSVTDTNEKQGDKGYDNVKEAAQWRLTRSSSIVGARKSCSSSYIPSRNSCSSTIDQPRNSCDMTELNYSKKKVAEHAASANSGRDPFVVERNKSVKCSSNDIDNGTLPFYLTPLRTSRSRKSTENKLTKPVHATGNVLH